MSKSKFKKFEEWLGVVVQDQQFDKVTIGFLRIAYRVGYHEGGRQEKEKQKRMSATEDRDTPRTPRRT